MATPNRIYGWWFSDRKTLRHGDGRRVSIGKTHTVTGKIECCKNGLHLSILPLDALHYAWGKIVWRVVGSGDIHREDDKIACSRRTYVRGGIDCSDVLDRFSRLCALDVIHLWDAPDIVVQYLRTGDPSIRDAARDAARDAMDAALYAGYAIGAARVARVAMHAGYAAMHAMYAIDAAGHAGYAARDAMYAIDAAIKDKQNKRLHRMLLTAIR